jgi:hypothetical protein
MFEYALCHVINIKERYKTTTLNLVVLLKLLSHTRLKPIREIISRDLQLVVSVNKRND